jgi:hypothetical protein
LGTGSSGHPQQKDLFPPKPLPFQTHDWHNFTKLWAKYGGKWGGAFRPFYPPPKKKRAEGKAIDAQLFIVVNPLTESS